MRTLPIIIAGALAASLGLSACGVKASLDEAVTSVGASPDVQIHLTASVSGAIDASAQAVLNSASIDLDYSNPTGAPLSQAGKNYDSEVVVNVGGHALVDLREIDQNLYVEVNVDALADVPGVNLTASQLATAQLLFGGRWFEATQSLLQSELPSASAEQAAVAKDQALERTLVKEIAAVIEHAKYTTLPGGGYSETGTLASLVKAVLPTIESVAGSSAPPSASKVQGTYTLTLTMAGTTATGASVSITAPSGQGGNATVGLTATIAHASQSVVVPPNATVLTPAILKSLGAGTA